MRPVCLFPSERQCVPGTLHTVREGSVNPPGEKVIYTYDTVPGCSNDSAQPAAQIKPRIFLLRPSNEDASSNS